MKKHFSETDNSRINGCNSNHSMISTPQLKCVTFSGIKPTIFEFKNVMAQFINCTNSVISNSAKLAILKSYLTGYALQLISHLSLEEDNYDIAMNLLTEEFLDVPSILYEIFKQLLSDSPTFDFEFETVKHYLAEVRADLSELKTSYGLDFYEDRSPGNQLVSHIVFDKLPNILRREIVHRAGTSYSSLIQIFENYNEAIRTLSKNKKPVRPNGNIRKGNNRLDVKESNGAALQNFATSTRPLCKFCSFRGHSMSGCTKYNTCEARVARCKAMQLCTTCSSTKHKSDQCSGLQNKLTCKRCASKRHIAPLCDSRRGVLSLYTHVCASASEENCFILPILSLNLHWGNKKVSVNCLLDTGSQRSYFSKDILKKLNCSKSISNPINFQVKTYLSTSSRELDQVMMKINVGQGRLLCLPILLDSQFDIHFKFDNFSEVRRNLINLNYRLAFSHNDNSDQIKIQGILGVDIFQFMENTRIIKCMKGSAWETPNGIAPFGNNLHFLHEHQIVPVEPGAFCGLDNYHAMVSEHSSCPEQGVRFVMDPKPSYPEIIPDTFDLSAVERNLERMFAVDSVTSSSNEDERVSNYDKNKINEFEKTIEFKDNSYYVQLPWYEDKIKLVPSNYQTALRMLDRTMQSLEKNQIALAYNEVFYRQESEGIIERIEVSPDQFSKYIWIPHRPVFKSEKQVTTKIRPVFNCSLKTGGGYSLNEAAYPGINMINDITKLLLLFQTNKYVLLGDIRKAFLMIKLKSDEDKNRFCFFVEEKDKLICFRYSTLIFGFNASPFILNYVLKFHINQFPYDKCTEMLRNNFYVDNLSKTSNSASEITSLYKEAVLRLQKGNFQLRSCNSNCDSLKFLMKKDGTIVQHGCNYDKVLGYNYYSSQDVLSIANEGLERNITTKRGVLAQSAKVFDPLSLCAPVTVTTKILLRKIWSLKLDWDEELPEDIRENWTQLAEELSGLHNLTFSRHAIDSDQPLRLYIFCDASPQAYGFVVYGVQNGKSQLVFSKVKVAPMKTKTLPTLELLAVYIAFRAIATLLTTYSHINIKNIYLAVDAQVVLSWLLSHEIKAKSLFTRNRLKDIRDMKEQLKQEYDVNIQYRYVPTGDNPADLLSRGVSLETFKQKLELWTHGPSWLTADPVSWPPSSLSCLSPENQNLFISNVFSNITEMVEEPIIPYDRFSDYKKLCKATTFIFKFVINCRRLKDQPDPKHIARSYLIKIMQSQEFNKEISYLKDPVNKETLILIKNLNVFFDTEGILRVDGRIGNSTRYGYDVMYPILIAKHHPLTELIIKDSHIRCKHLGIGATVSKLRLYGYWVPQARQSVRSVISKCYICKKYNSITFRYTKLTNLPKHRVKLINPFQHTGVDYTGHLWVQREGKYHKMYILIFTCLSVRAIHIELVPDMSTQAFIQALVRFCNIYGTPSHIYSDNARSFIAALCGNVIGHHVESDGFSNTFTDSVIKHVRIPLYSPWIGSTWERMIKVVKSCLFKSLGRSKVEYFHLLTLLSDIQRAVNSRPLTYRCSSDFGLLPLTPNYFIHPNANNEQSFTFDTDTPSSVDSEPTSRSLLIDTLENREELLNKFKKMWYEEYLLSLREICKDLHETEFSNKININDVILIKNPAKPRPFWLLGRVIELFSGSDHKVRSARIKRGDGTIETHSLKHLYPLELSLTHKYFPNTPPNEVSNERKSPTPQNHEQPNNMAPKQNLNNTRPNRKKRKRPDSEYLYY